MRESECAMFVPMSSATEASVRGRLSQATLPKSMPPAKNVGHHAKRTLALLKSSAVLRAPASPHETKSTFTRAWICVARRAARRRASSSTTRGKQQLPRPATKSTCSRRQSSSRNPRCHRRGASRIAAASAIISCGGSELTCLPERSSLAAGIRMRK